MTITSESRKFWVRPWMLIVAAVVCAAMVEAAAAQQSPSAPAPVRTEASAATGADVAAQLLVRTESPRQTLATFIRLRDALERAAMAYRQDSSSENVQWLALVFNQMESLYDFTHIPSASRKDAGGETAAYVLDILGRIPLPNLDDVPDLASVGESGLDHYAIPKTPLHLVRMDDGPRTGQFLFSANTVQTAPWFYRGIERLPLKSSLPIRSWIEESRQLTGPMIPAALVDAIPAGLKHSLFGTPVWKAMVVVASVLAAAFLLVFLRRMVRLGEATGPEARLWRRLLGPVAVVAATSAIQAFADHQLNVTGAFALGFDTALNGVLYLALAWAVWLAALAVFETLIGRRAGSGKDIDANMLRLLARIVAVVGVIIVLATGAQAVGVPIISVLAGLGVGGLAVALAIRPTLENLIGGMILYLDKPIRVGDYCGFGGQDGTVENIGVRSTVIRARDRTVISIPNAQFADMPIVNWTQCDQMLIQETIGLRYETGGDQLRDVLEKMREMLRGHPRIDPETVRVRFVGYGSSSLDVSIRVFVMTQDWNDFLAVKEDVLFNLKAIVEGSGTGFAFPSQTLYLRTDAGPAPDLTDRTKREDASLRRSGNLPVPRFVAAALERVAGTTGHPPGSSDHPATEGGLASRDERLSDQAIDKGGGESRRSSREEF